MSTKASNKTTLCFAGDLYLKSRNELCSVMDKSVVDFLNSGDACFVNFASPATGFRKSYTKYTPSIKRDINCSAPDVLADFPELFPDGIVSLANDHLGDRGSVGIIDTLESFEKYGVPFIGAGRFPDEELKYRIFGDDVKVGVIAILGRKHGIRKFRNKVGPLRSRRKEDIAAMISEVREKCDYLVLIYHGGRRYNNVAEPAKRAAISKYLDAGCDVVVAHHPHVIQRPEIINGKYVFYSIGDLFLTERADVMGAPMEGLVLRLEFTGSGIKPYLQYLDITEDHVALSDKEYVPSYINSENEYKAAWAEAEKEKATIRAAYIDYNRRWKLAAYKDELERIDRTLELIEKNRGAAKIEGIEERLNTIKGILERKTAFIYNKMSETDDIDAEEFDEETEEKSASEGIL
ncbi:MAG: CapA family protein [Mogibacterium sp.]|nr:CapA family protein [Mogibacterium sp.]